MQSRWIRTASRPGCQPAGHEILNDEGILLFEEMYELSYLLFVAFHFDGDVNYVCGSAGLLVCWCCRAASLPVMNL